MRTSGAATESRLTIAMGIVAILFLMVLAGGPRELMVLVEDGMWAVAETIYQAWVSFRR